MSARMLIFFIRESEDTALMFLREIYAMSGVMPEKIVSARALPRVASSPLGSLPSSQAAPGMAPPPTGPPPMGLPPMSAPPMFAPPPAGSASAARGLPTSRPQRVVDHSIYGGGSPAAAVMPPHDPFVYSPPPMAGFVKKS